MKRRKRGPKPRYINCRIFCRKKWGEDNCRDALISFYQFLLDSDMKELDLRRYECVLGGQLFGRHGHINGDITSTPIDSIERVKVGQSRDDYIFSNDLFTAKTESGENYFFYAQEIDPYVMVMISEFMEKGCLTGGKKWNDPHYYLHPNYYKGEVQVKNFDFEKFF